MNQKGAVLMSLLILMPLITAVISVLAATLLILKTYTGMQHQCRTQVLEAQDRLVTGLNELMTLNPQASRLRTERRLAERAFRIAPAGAKVVALLYLNTVIARQIALGSRQKLIVARAEAAANRALKQANRAIRKTQQEDSLGFHAKQKSGAVHVRTPRARLRLQSSPPRDLTPHYRPVLGFESRQTLTIEWRFNPMSLLPSWLPLETSQNMELKSRCSSRPSKKEGIKWTAKPGKAKSWWN